MYASSTSSVIRKRSPGYSASFDEEEAVRAVEVADRRRWAWPARGTARPGASGRAVAGSGGDTTPQMSDRASTRPSAMAFTSAAWSSSFWSA